MKRFCLALSVGLILVAAATVSSTAPPADTTPRHVSIESGPRNPWTNLQFNDRRDNFQFVIVTDRTGGRRPGVFRNAVDQINLLQPEFVVSVGDLIEGYTEDPGQWALEWSEFETMVDRLEMPFFFCAGNHDISNLPMSQNWTRRFRRSYYHFLYHDCLFLVLNSEDPPKQGDFHFSQAQRDWATEVLKKNRDVRWTFVVTHKPTWTYPNADLAKQGWTQIENALAGRKYTVFTGHKHAYARFIRRGQEYYMLATTGGGSTLSGVPEGRFDHFVWVTMTEKGPVLANLLLDGVKSKTLRTLADPSAGK
ncbi:MAG: metallophosphoesterase [Planctomycetota bacterium]|nr:metallophosphoesterase [Planctomycetota bacterium]